MNYDRFTWHDGDLTPVDLTESNPNQPRNERGEFTSTGGSDDSIAHRTMRHRGGSFSTHGEGRPTTGYMVADKPHERIVKLTTDSKAELKGVIRQYREDNREALSRPSVYLGTWLANGQVFMDNSHLINDRRTAFAMAHDEDQLAVYNNVTKEVEDTMSDGERPSKSKGRLNESDVQSTPDASIVKHFFSNEMTDDEIVDALLPNAK
jgi:hypothetical protein